MAQHGRIAGRNDVARFEDLPKLIVRRQLNRSGNALLAALEPLSDAELYAPGPSGISAAWTLGHLACVADLFGAALDDGKLALSVETHDMFNGLDIGGPRTASKAEGVDREQYPKSRLLVLMRTTQVRLLKVLDAFDVRTWNDPSPDRLADTLPTLGAVWEHLSVHTYWHLGELSGSVERFYGTYTMNSMPHYFAWGENDTEAARRAREQESQRPSEVGERHSMVMPRQRLGTVGG